MSPPTSTSSPPAIGSPASPRACTHRTSSSGRSRGCWTRTRPSRSSSRFGPPSTSPRCPSCSWCFLVTREGRVVIRAARAPALGGHPDRADPPDHGLLRGQPARRQARADVPAHDLLRDFGGTLVGRDHRVRRRHGAGFPVGRAEGHHGAHAHPAGLRDRDGSAVHREPIPPAPGVAGGGRVAGWWCVVGGGGGGCRGWCLLGVFFFSRRAGWGGGGFSLFRVALLS